MLRDIRLGAEEYASALQGTSSQTWQRWLLQIMCDSHARIERIRSISQRNIHSAADQQDCAVVAKIDRCQRVEPVLRGCEGSGGDVSQL